MSVKTGCKTCHIVNASGVEELVVELDRNPVASELFDVTGEPLPPLSLKSGLQRIHIPCSGLLTIQYGE